MLGENSRFFLCILVTLVVLLPSLQIIQLDFMHIQTADAAGSITLNGTKSTSGSVVVPLLSIQISNFNVGTGSNRLLVVGVEANTASVSSITFGGTSLTKKVSSFTNNDAEFWYLKNPNGTANIAVTMSAPSDVIVGAYSFFGVNQTSPIPTTNTAHNTSNSSPSISLTTVYANSVVLDSPAINGAVTLSSPTCTQRWNLHVSNVLNGGITGASSSKSQVTAGSVTCSWTASGSGELWDDVAIEIKAAGVIPPTAPTNSNSTAISTTQVKISWTAPSDNGGSSITGYKIQKASTSWTNVINDTGNAVTNYNVTGLAANSVYKYRIAAWNGVGLGAYSANVTGYTLPGVPTSLSATNASSSQINLSWTAPGGNATISGYKIERSADGGSIWSTIVTNTGSAGTTYSNTGLAASTTYMYRTSAINSGGTGSSSNTASATTNTAPPSLHSSTGILEPLYSYPYNNTNGQRCTSATCFAWNPINATKNNHPQVPFFVVVNPASGPCDLSPPSSNCVADPNYQQGIANLTRSGVIVLGYVDTVWFDYGTGLDGGCPCNKTQKGWGQVKSEINNWINLYGTSKLGNLGIKGIMFDDMQTFPYKTGNLTYYQNLTNYVHSNSIEHLTYSFANPGTDVNQNFQNTMDLLNIYEGDNSTGDLTNSTLQGSPNQWHVQHSKDTYSFMQHGKPNPIFQKTIQGKSVYASLMFVTSDDMPNPWDVIPPYLNTLASYLDNASVLSTITAKDKLGNILSIPIQISQSNNLVRNGTTPFVYNATSGWQFSYTAPQTYSSYNFCNWTYTGTNSTNHSILVAPTINRSYTATYTSNTC